MEATKVRLGKPPSPETGMGRHLLGSLTVERCFGAALAASESAGQGQLGYGLQVS